MIEQDPITRIDPIAFAIVPGYPVRINFCSGVGALWLQGSRFVLRRL